MQHTGSASCSIGGIALGSLLVLSPSIAVSFLLKLLLQPCNAASEAPVHVLRTKKLSQVVKTGKEQGCFEYIDEVACQNLVHCQCRMHKGIVMVPNPVAPLLTNLIITNNIFVQKHIYRYLQDKASYTGIMAAKMATSNLYLVFIGADPLLLFLGITPWVNTCAWSFKRNAYQNLQL